MFNICLFFQNKKNYYIGNLMAMSIVHGGSGFPYMASPMYEYLCGTDMSEIKVNKFDVPNTEVKHLFDQVNT